MNPLELARARPGPAFTVTFDGRPVEALPGQTVAAVLWAAGVTSWRDTRREGRPRGVFCGIGVCFDCLVTVNGRPNQRACLVPVRPGDEIGTQDGTGHGERGTRGGAGRGEAGTRGGAGRGERGTRGGAGRGEAGTRGGTSHGEMDTRGGTGHGEMDTQDGTGQGEAGTPDGTGRGEAGPQDGTGHGETGTPGGGTGHEEARHAD